MYVADPSILLATGPALPTAEERERAELLAEERALYAQLIAKWQGEMMPALRRAMRAHLAALLECARAGRIAEEFVGVPGFPQVPPTLVCSAEQLAELARSAIGAGLVDAADPVVSEIDEFLNSAEG